LGYLGPVLDFARTDSWYPNGQLVPELAGSTRFSSTLLLTRMGAIVTSSADERRLVLVCARTDSWYPNGQLVPELTISTRFLAYAVIDKNRCHCHLERRREALVRNKTYKVRKV